MTQGFKLTFPALDITVISMNEDTYISKKDLIIWLGDVMVATQTADDMLETSQEDVFSILNGMRQMLKHIKVIK